MILNALKPRKALNKAFLQHHTPRNPNRPIGLPALWVDGGGDWDCGEGVNYRSFLPMLITGKGREAKVFYGFLLVGVNAWKTMESRKALKE